MLYLNTFSLKTFSKKFILIFYIFESRKLWMKTRSLLQKLIKFVLNDSQEIFSLIIKSKRNSKVLNSRWSQFIVKNIIWRFAYFLWKYHKHAPFPIRAYITIDSNYIVNQIFLFQLNCEIKITLSWDFFLDVRCKMWIEKLYKKKLLKVHKLV